MKTLTSRYEFEIITTDDSLMSEKCNTIELENTGDVDFVIDEVIKVSPGTSKILGGRTNVAINQEFEIVFPNAGTKSCTITKEFIE